MGASLFLNNVQSENRGRLLEVLGEIRHKMLSQVLLVRCNILYDFQNRSCSVFLTNEEKVSGTIPTAYHLGCNCSKLQFYHATTTLISLMRTEIITLCFFYIMISNYLSPSYKTSFYKN